MQPLTNDATTALLRAVRAGLLQHAPNGKVIFEEIRSRSWASVTFTGARHEFTLLLAAPDAAEAASRFGLALDTAEFKLRGHILADIALLTCEPCDAGVRLRMEALTVED